MDHARQRRAVAHGAARWQAPRLKPQVKKRGVQKVKKSGKTAVERELHALEKSIEQKIAQERNAGVEYSDAARAAQAPNREESLRAAQTYGARARRGPGRALQ